MKTLGEYIAEAETKKVAIGHFNVSDTEGVWAVFRSAEGLKLPVIIGVSEGERDFIGVRQISALVKSLRETYNYPVFLNADHTYSVERVREVVDAGFDAVIFDGSSLTLEENINLTRECVSYAYQINPEMLVEGELGFIGKSSKLLDEIPAGVDLSSEGLTKPEVAQQFAEATGVNLLSPAVGNIHGMLKGVAANPKLDIERIKLIRQMAGVPLVLHGGSGSSVDDFRQAIKAGISIVHINTELRLAYRDAIKLSLQENPDELAPYKFMKAGVTAMQKLVEEKLKLFNNL